MIFAVVLLAGHAIGDPERHLFRIGQYDRSVLVGVLPNLPNAPLRGRAAACASCHGADASGTIEGGLVVPPLRGAWLGTPRRGLRGAYDETTFLQSLRYGIMPGRAVPGPAMPRYAAIDRTDAIRIWQWLLRSEVEPENGVSDGEIVLAVPYLDGPRERALLPGLIDAISRSLAGPIHGRLIRLHPVALPGGKPTTDCGQPALATVAGLGLARDDTAAAAARACFPLRVFTAADALPDDLGPMQTDVADLALALAQRGVAEGRRIVVLTSERADLSRAARTVADAMGLTRQPCGQPPTTGAAILLLCNPSELAGVLSSLSGSDLLIALDLFGEAELPFGRNRFVLADPRGRIPELGGTGEIARMGRAIALFLAKSLRAAGRAVDQDGLRRAVLNLGAHRDGSPDQGLCQAR